MNEPIQINITYGYAVIRPEPALIYIEGEPFQKQWRSPADWLMPIMGFLIVLAGNHFGAVLIGVWLAIKNEERR